MESKSGISDEEKVQIFRRLLSQAPPGEFSEVFNDVRTLLKKDSLLRDHISKAAAQYNLDQFIPVEVKNQNVLLTEYGDLGKGYFLDPARKISFKVNHMSKEASDVQTYAAQANMETWRSSVESVLTAYVKDHYPYGVCTVYGKTLNAGKAIIACIECHKYQPNVFWNGLWKSEWKFVLSPPCTEVTGTIKVRAHYFEEGSISLISSFEVNEKLSLTNELETATNFVKLIENADNAFQVDLMDNYQKLDILLKGLRRHLPFTRTTLDWNKVINSKVVKEMDLGQGQ
ncbi:F-actin-capping protein subunit alpha-1-like [Callorhinchus milii]|uniref:F-actin-capping protein subunit alpha-1-like n=1 Tax=Callorhinchus milii TaxID=7868 RepID=UPI001C3F6E21|nr:F-actin-capping protein subunit alpha-1-like [Callorhinchus milii]